MVRALEAAAGNQSQAVRILRIGRDALRYKLKKHGLEKSTDKHAEFTHSKRGTGTVE